MNVFKRFTSFMLSIIMVASCLAIFSFAATDVVFEISSTEAVPGKNITVVVKATENPGIAGITGQLNFDKNVLTPVSVTNGSANSMSITTNLDSGVSLGSLDYVTVTCSRASNMTKTGDFFVFTFKVKSNATGSTQVEFFCKRSGGVINQSLKDLSFNYPVGKINIKTDTTEPSNPPTPVTPTDETVFLKSGADKIKYMKGYSNGKFMPKQDATRYEVVEAFYNLFTVTVQSKDSGFKDVDSKYKAMVDLFVAAGVINGYPSDNTFRGTKTITRAEFCKIVCVLLSMETSDKVTDDLNDIKGHWAEDYITACYEAGYVQGKGEGRFAPNANITRAEVCTLINRITGAKAGTSCAYDDVKNSDWFFGAVAAAAK